MEVKKVGFSDEQKALLKKSVGFTIRSDFFYTPKAFLTKVNGEYVIPRDQWTIFRLRGIGGIDRARAGDDAVSPVVDASGKIVNMKINTSAMSISACKRGIVSVKNLYDEWFNIIEIGRPDPYTKQLSDDDINKLSPELIYEVADAILSSDAITNEELLGLEF